MAKKTIQCYAPDEVIDKLAYVAKHYRRTASAMVRELIEAEHERLTKPAPPARPKLDLLGN